MFKFDIGDHVSFVFYQAVVNGGRVIARKIWGSTGGPEYRVAGFSGWWAEENLVLVSRGSKNSPNRDEAGGPTKDQPGEPKCDTDENTAVWIWHEADGYFECSKCRRSALNDYRGRSTDSLYCPHCGKRMTNSTMPLEDD